MASSTHHPIAARLGDAVKDYGEGDTVVRALDHVSVEFRHGTFTAVMGPSGSGKSTLLHCIAGLDSLTAGEAAIGGTVLGELSDRRLTELRRERIGFVFQAFNLLPTMDARDNILLPLRLAGAHPDAAWMDQVVATLGIGDRLHHRPSELSGGQQQRVAVARALVTRPDVILADEPTGNLDSTSGRELLAFLQEAVRELDQTVVMVTHDPAAATFAQRCVFLADGRIASDLEGPTVDGVLETMRALGEGMTHAERSAPAGGGR